MIIKMTYLVIIFLLLISYESNKHTNIKTKNSTIVINDVVKPSIQLYPVIKYRNTGIDIYSDIFDHSKQEPYTESSRRINSHETSHGITSELRKYYSILWKTKLNVFYVLNGKCIILNESNTTMSQVIEYIPPVLKSYRYNLYFVEKIKDWDDMPSYIIDEWNSYILGSMVAVQDYENNIPQDRGDAVSGCLDFSIYAVCFAMSVKDNDPTYYKEYPQFKETIKYLLIQAEKTFNKGLNIEPFVTATQLKLLNDLRHHKDSKNIRDFLINEFDGIFVK
jgi:hypothetical protein